MVNISRRNFLSAVLTTITGTIVYRSVTVNQVNPLKHDNLQEVALNLKGINFELSDKYQLDYFENKILSKLGQNVLESENLYVWIQKTIQSEFKENKTINVNGWIISEFERDMFFYAILKKKKEGILTVADPMSFESAKSVDFIKIKNWGPKTTCVGSPFNEQSDGHSSHWFSIEPYNGTLKIYIGDELVPTTKGAKVITTRIDGNSFSKITSQARSLEVYIYDPSRNIKKNIGNFEIYPRSDRQKLDGDDTISLFGEISNWGPRSIDINTYSVHKHKDYILWVKTNCAPAKTVILIGHIPLKTTVGPNLVTGILNKADLKLVPGKKSVKLRDQKSGQSVTLGELKISGPQ